MSAGRWKRPALVGLVVIALAALLAPVTAQREADAYRGAPPFQPGTSYDENFPDPHVIHVGGTYYAYATNTGGALLPTMSSTDHQNWVAHGDTLARPPRWAATRGGVPEIWAPQVVNVNGGWRAYYGVRENNASPARYCISVATGPGPLGPFVDNSSGPITCGFGPTGAIDPWVYVDSGGTPWLLWKTEPFEGFGFIPSFPSAIWSHRLRADGLAYGDQESALIILEAGAGWENGVIENPAMFESNGRLHLLYSGSFYASGSYATGWATCSSPSGPCSRARSGPILASFGNQLGPGGGAVFEDRFGDLQFAYHWWNAPFTSYPVWPWCDTDGDGVCADQGQRRMDVMPICEFANGSISAGIPAGWPFCDVSPSSWYGPSVGWMSGTQLTTGVSTNRYAPERGVTRAETVTMRWRWAGEPEPSRRAPFSDVGAFEFYSDAVAWATETGLVTGTSPTTFEPNLTTQRAHIAVLFHRIADEIDVDRPTGFTDVPADEYYTDAVEWLASTGITTGVTPTQFQPTATTTRAQLATFVCRLSLYESGHPELIVDGAVDTCAAG